jgi:hypothetical protein
MVVLHTDSERELFTLYARHDYRGFMYFGFKGLPKATFAEYAVRHAERGKYLASEAAPLAALETELRATGNETRINDIKVAASHFAQMLFADEHFDEKGDFEVGSGARDYSAALASFLRRSTAPDAPTLTDAMAQTAGYADAEHLRAAARRPAPAIEVPQTLLSARPFRAGTVRVENFNEVGHESNPNKTAAIILSQGAFTHLAKPSMDIRTDEGWKEFVGNAEPTPPWLRKG